MTRRFLTADDVRRAGGTEIAVDESTLVTPQAIEAARAAGITIRTPAGPWAEPTVDRGPDAEIAAMRIGLLERTSEDARVAHEAVVTAVGRNRPGVLAEITTAISACGLSVRDISQKMIEGYFHLLLTIDLPEGGSLGDVKETLEALGSGDDYIVRVMHERVFHYMHRV